MKIIETIAKTDFYGGQSTITVYDDGSARLVCRTQQGNVFHDRTYNTLKGAKIALGKMH